MIVSYNWLREFVDCNCSPAELADLLTMLGLEVEAMHERGAGMDDIVVAVVEEKLQHPNADKLSLCKVNNGSEIFAVVCGAQNFKAGDKVALAQLGAVLPGDFKIKKSKIRGEESCGMLCSEKELGLAADSEGIMILPASYPLGLPLFTAMGARDTIFEIGLTPNRADCLSVVGIAREVAAKLGKKITVPGLAVAEVETTVSSKAKIVVEDPDFCPRYTARYITGCKIAPSPSWLVKRLEAVGMRSINNVVDVTNYVLLEYGHPLHAFDFDRLDGGTIIVRRAAEGETFTTLDGQERLLTSSDLTIRDASKAVALAGIMGGENSEISDSTTNILLESAYFNPSAIRKTSKRLGLHTESSHRFERGADVNILPRAIDRAASLIAELAGGEIASGIIDVYPYPVVERIIPFRVQRSNELLGLTLSEEEAADIFRRLEFTVIASLAGTMEIRVPSFRVDIEREIDLVEEVARLHGYDQIPVTMPRASVFSDRPPLHQLRERRLKDLMVAHGFNEVINFSFMAPDALDKILLGPEDQRRSCVNLLNPLVVEQSVMRTCLLPGLLETAARNLNYRTTDQRLFELRRVYYPVTGRELPNEPMMLGGVLTGKRWPEGWNQETHPVDFFDAKGVVETVLDDFGVRKVAFAAGDSDKFYHPGKSCRIVVRNETIGSIGELHPDVLVNFEIAQDVYYFELDFEKLVSYGEGKSSITPPSKFPDTFRDSALLVADEIPVQRIIDAVSALKLREVEDVMIFDLYKGANILEGMKSVAIRVRYRSTDRTLIDEEVSVLHKRVVDSLIKKLNVSIR